MKAIAASSVMKDELKLISSMRLIISRAVLGTSARSIGGLPGYASFEALPFPGALLSWMFL
jgi:hypothetical protein